MIKANKLIKQFDKRGIAGLHNLSFNLKNGEIMGIMGPNGSGKTTLLKVLAGIISLDEGQFTIDGKVSFFSAHHEAEEINVQLFLIQAVTLDIEEEKKIQLARDLADTFEFTFQLKQKLSELSSGQKQKVLLAKELINRPSLLLMDEPFTHLDPFTRKDILKNLFNYIRNQKITVLWVTHDIEEAFNFSDVIGVMNFGKFEQFSSPEELIQKPMNLFVAKFVGYRNFFPIKKLKDGWSTPWGTRTLPSLASQDALLIVPDHSWKLGEDNVTFSIIQRYAGKQVMEYTLSREERVFHLTLGSQCPLFNTGQEVKLAPIWEQCLTIEL
jgi:ABC-type sugar transport system ATPase subunit